MPNWASRRLSRLARLLSGPAAAAEDPPPAGALLLLLLADAAPPAAALRPAGRLRPPLPCAMHGWMHGMHGIGQNRGEVCAFVCRGEVDR